MNEPIMQLDVAPRGRVTVARVTGEIDASNVGDLKLTLTQRIPNDSFGLVIDLTGTTYIDSAGISLLFELSERLRWRGQTMRVTLPTEAPIRRILAITRLDTLVPVVNQLAIAIAEVDAASSSPAG